MTELAVVIVHYHAPALAAAAVAALRENAGQSAISTEYVVVDNGSDADGADVLRGIGVPIVSSGRNLGYAGGVNLGVAETHAPLVIVMNPDVMVQPGCLGALCAELRQGIAAAGPSFSWDRAGRLMLPPTERRDPISEGLTRASVDSPRWARRARLRWRQHARRHWTARTSLPSYALSGALIAFRRDVWADVGPFDDGFRLYFEETDWLARLAARGHPARYVPHAHAHHIYNSSARNEPAAGAWFAESAARFASKHPVDPSAWQPGAKRGSTAGPEGGPAYEGDLLDVGRTGLWSAADAEGGLWIEISPSSTGFPAASERLEAGARGWTLPADVWDHLAPGRYVLRLVTDAGRELVVHAFHR